MDLLDDSILETINRGREEFGACTARWVAHELNLSPDMCRYRLLTMKDHGLVTWNDMPGSLRVTQPESASTDESQQDQEPPSETRSAETAQPTPADPPSATAEPESSTPPKATKKQAAKKRAATRR